MIQPPAKHPCGSCPYRKDTPSGVWAEEEYAKLATYDDPAATFSVFLCHQQNQRLCSGWVGVHDMENMLGLRLVVNSGQIAPEDIDAICDYTTDVPLHESGAAAAEHGMREIDAPPEKARKIVNKLIDQPTPIRRTF